MKSCNLQESNLSSIINLESYCCYFQSICLKHRDNHSLKQCHEIFLRIQPKGSQKDIVTSQLRLVQCMLINAIRLKLDLRARYRIQSILILSRTTDLQKNHYKYTVLRVYWGKRNSSAQHFLFCTLWLIIF